MNEHLIEALRRLRKSSSDTNVDRRLVTNVFLSFLSTPRADPKRFEMLGLIGTILGWGEAERERAGLIKGLGAATGGGTSGSASSSSGGGLFWGRGNGAASPGKSKNVELEKTDETESFSRLWVEFLLTEANQGESQSHPQPHLSTPSNPPLHASLPNSPAHSPNRVVLASTSNGPGASPTGLKGTRRLGSWTAVGSAAMTTVPNLNTAGPPPSRKGKEKEVNP